MSPIGHFVANKPWRGTSARIGNVFDPATGIVTGKVTYASSADVDSIVDIAVRAQPGWAATPVAERAQVISDFGNLVKAHADELATLLSSEHGMPLRSAKIEIAQGIEAVAAACGLPQLLEDQPVETDARSFYEFQRRQPVGVIAGIVQCNSPVVVPLSMFPAAIVCGNTFILKPNEQTPTVTFRIAELLAEAGLPAGVFNLVNGDEIAIDALADNRTVDAISFVGPRQKCQEILTLGTANETRVQALTIERNLCVIFPDADLDKVVDVLVESAFRQGCSYDSMISAVLPVGDETADRLIELLEPRLRALNVAPFTDPKADIGPAPSERHLREIQDLISEEIAQGAMLVVDGRDVQIQNHEMGFFIGACLLDIVAPETSMTEQEFAGPVLLVARAETCKDAIQIINSGRFGSTLSIFTQSQDLAHDLWKCAGAGLVRVNATPPAGLAYRSISDWRSGRSLNNLSDPKESIQFHTHLQTIATQNPLARGAEPEMNLMSGKNI